LGTRSYSCSERQLEPVRLDHRGVGFDLCEVALLGLDPVELVPDDQLVAQLVQLLAGYLAPAEGQGRLCALDLRDAAGGPLGKHGVGKGVAHRLSTSS
jgi:hypothetical protein